MGRWVIWLSAAGLKVVRLLASCSHICSCYISLVLLLHLVEKERTNTLVTSGPRVIETAVKGCGTSGQTAKHTGEGEADISESPQINGGRAYVEPASQQR